MVSFVALQKDFLYNLIKYSYFKIILEHHFLVFYQRSKYFKCDILEYLMWKCLFVQSSGGVVTGVDSTLCYWQTSITCQASTGSSQPGKTCLAETTNPAWPGSSQWDQTSVHLHSQLYVLFGCEYMYTLIKQKQWIFSALNGNLMFLTGCILKHYEGRCDV